MAVAAPADKRFRRAQVKPARKRKGLLLRRWRAAAVVVVIGLALYTGRRIAAVVTELEIFDIEHINVRGNHRLSTGEVLALVDGLRGRSILAIDLEEWRRQLLNSPWVADVSLRRTLPASVEVTILERAPLGIGRINGALYLVDERGKVIDEYGPNYADLDLPIIDGLSGRSGAADTSGGTPAAGDQHSDIYRAMLARRLIDALRGSMMAGLISQIDVSDAQNAVVLLEDDPTRIRLGHERFVERLESYFELAPALREQVPVMDYVDLRFDERVYVRPAQKKTTNQKGISNNEAARRPISPRLQRATPKRSDGRRGA
ncbi:MAG: FtsQ-type POTRA domain-containing protein [Acidobacteria bacterium]|nr:MAG: FtsQ-type POTRA domain-containing protein [Acidobacteriota bacterium]